MAICPFAVQRLLPENSSQPFIVPRAIILHTAVDSPTPNSSIHDYFARSDVGVESHFYVKDNGEIEQYIDTGRSADANLDANGFAISIETEDDGNPDQNAWNSAQLNSLVKLCAWLCDTHKIPKSQIPKWNGSGIGWHSMWGAPSHWTPSAGKTCPGPKRIPQVPLIIKAVASNTALQEDDPDMAFDAAAQAKLDEVHLRVFSMHANKYLPTQYKPEWGGDLSWVQDQLKHYFDSNPLTVNVTLTDADKADLFTKLAADLEAKLEEKLAPLLDLARRLES